MGAKIRDEFYSPKPCFSCVNGRNIDIPQMVNRIPGIAIQVPIICGRYKYNNEDAQL